MRIAAIMAGEPRFCREFDLFVDSLKNYESVDWYMFFWANSRAGGTHGFDLVAPKWLDVDREWAIEKLRTSLPENHRIVGLVLADRTQVQTPDIVHKAGETNVERMWGMYNSLHQADLLRQSAETRLGAYDLVIRARPDVGLRGSVDLGELCDIVKDNPRALITPNTEIHGYGHKINDMIAFGSSNSMTVYTDAVHWIPEYHSRGLIFHPETMLAYHCAAQKLDVVEKNFGEIVLRKLGTQIPNGPYLSDFGRWA